MKNNVPRGVYAGRMVEDFVLYAVNQECPDKGNGKVTYTSTGRYVGGAGANAAAAFSMLSQKTYHNNGATLYTAVGNHASIEIHQDIKRTHLIIEDCSPGDDFRLPYNVTGVLSEGNRLIFRDGTEEGTIYSEMDIVLPSALIPNLEHDLEKADIAQIEMRCPKLTLQFMEKVRAYNVPLILDAGGWQTWSPELIAGSDIVIASKDFKPQGQKDLSTRDTIDYLESMGVQKIAVTRGKSRIVYKEAGQSTDYIEIDRVPEIDTLAAGDIMHGAFGYYFALSNDFRSSLEKAGFIASQRVQYLGPRQGIENLTPEQILPQHSFS
jgi:sugar/nucleoside kinase (ribokinase family)